MSLEVRAFEALASHPKLSDLVSLATPVLNKIVCARETHWGFSEDVSKAMEDEASPYRSVDPVGDFGAPVDVLRRGPQNADERALAAALYAHSLAESKEPSDAWVLGLPWLSTHLNVDALSLIDRALGERAPAVWETLSDAVLREGALARAEALVTCIAIGQAAHSELLAKKLSGALPDGPLRKLLAPAPIDAKPEKKEAPAISLEFVGELGSYPRGPVATTLLAATGILLITSVLRSVGRLALQYKRPARVAMTGTSIEVSSHTEILGRRLRERRDVFEMSGLVQVTREVRYPRLVFYTGLLALALGTYVGVRALSDGTRAASPSLLASGALLIALGITIDFVFSSLSQGAQGKCRLLFLPQKGKGLSVEAVPLGKADTILTSLKGATG